VALDIHGLVKNANHLDAPVVSAIEDQVPIDLQFPIAGANLIAGYAKVRKIGQAPGAAIQLLR